MVRSIDCRRVAVARVSHSLAVSWMIDDEKNGGRPHCVLGGQSTPTSDNQTQPGYLDGAQPVNSVLCGPLCACHVILTERARPQLFAVVNSCSRLRFFQR